MYLEYEEKEEKYQFRYWLTHVLPVHKDNFWYVDVNQWIIDQFGPIGERWGWDKKRDNVPDGSRRSTVRNIHYCWRFKDKADAMHFKLRWFSQD